MSVRIISGDCAEVLRTLPAATFDACVTDPPYGLAFMGKAWDAAGNVAMRPETWAEVLRTLKPGAHLLAFGGTRTFHRMACAIEDAGFEIRDCVTWLYGSGFPKSLDVSKAIDKARDDSAEGHAVGNWLREQREQRGFKQKDVATLWPSATGGLTGCVANWETVGKVPTWDQWLQLKSFIGFGDEMDSEVWRLNGRKGTPGNEREVIGTASKGSSPLPGNHAGSWGDGQRDGDFDITAPATAAARQWQGWGTALKPAWEPIILARRPLAGTVAANVLAHGTGALNVDGCRVDGTKGVPASPRKGANGGDAGGVYGRFEVPPTTTAGWDANAGRWPANVIHDGSAEVLAAFAAFGERGGGFGISGGDPGGRGIYGKGFPRGDMSTVGFGDTGTAARFFYSAKADAADRLGSKHPTVKPVDLMRYLCRLVTQPGGHILDPFAGSGTTGMAAMAEGFRATLIEREADYCADIRRRIAHVTGADTPLFAEVSA